MIEPDAENANQYLHAARRIRNARTCADTASALLRAVVTGQPRSRTEWMMRAAARSVAEECLRRLELTLIQRGATSPELASDFRLDTSRALLRVLRQVSTLPADSVLGFADIAVAAVASLGRHANPLDHAGRATSVPCAHLTLGGQLFIPAQVAALADARSIDRDRLETLLMTAGSPLRKACEAASGNVGQLHARRDFPDLGLSLRATLDTSMGETPLIRIALATIDTPDDVPADIDDTPTQGQAFTTRLMRTLLT